MHRYVGCFLQVIGAGAIAGLLQSLLIWAVGQFGFFTLLHLPLSFDFNPAWFYQRISWGGLWGMLFLIQIFRKAPHMKRGLLFGLIPALASLLFFLPFMDGQGYLGLNLGIMMPFVVVVFGVIWGMIAGWLMDLPHLHKKEAPGSASKD